MSAYRAEACKGWPMSWYVAGNQNADLRCPAVGCNVVFRTIEEVKNLRAHMYEPRQDPDTGFHHVVLLEMFKVRDCHKCEYVQFDLDNDSPDIFNSRELFMHERIVHGSEELSHPKKFIGLIREGRDELFGGAPEIWPLLHKYFIRNIQKHPEFRAFAMYLEEYYPSFSPPTQDWQFDHMLKGTPRLNLPEWSKEFKEKYQDYYPVKSNEFLANYKKLQDPRAHNGEALQSCRIMKGGFNEGDF